MKTFVVIPSYEPDKNLVDLCKKLIDKGILNIVIVDDGTKKESSSQFFTDIENKYKNIVILHHPENLGKGRALKTAFSYLLNNTDADGCVTADSDGQHKVPDIIKCIQALEKNPDKLVMGCRKFDWNETPLKSRIGNQFTLKTFMAVTGTMVSDTQTGLRGLSAKLMQDCLTLKGERFEFEMNMLVSFIHRYGVYEVPIACIYKEQNKGTHFKPIKDSIKIIRMMHAAAKCVGC